MANPLPDEALQKSLMAAYRTFRLGAQLSDPTEASAQVQFDPVVQAWLENARLFVASGHADGGHHLLSPSVLFVRGGEVRYVTPGFFDHGPDGLTRLLACRPGWVKQAMDVQREKDGQAKLRELEKKECVDLTPELKASIRLDADEPALRTFAEFLMTLEGDPGSRFVEGEEKLDPMMKAALHDTPMNGISIQPPKEPVTVTPPRLTRTKGVVTLEGFAVKAGQAESSLERVTLRLDGAGFALKSAQIASWGGHIY